MTALYFHGLSIKAPDSNLDITVPKKYNVKELKKHPEFEVITCVTGQHRQMLDQVLDLFKIKPDYDLNIMKANQKGGKNKGNEKEQYLLIHKGKADSFSFKIPPILALSRASLSMPSLYSQT